MIPHQSEVIPVARRLLGFGAFQGAATILFHAAIQRQAAEVDNGLEWTPSGFLPLRPRQPRPHLNASNDHDEPSLDTA